jgi:hypothetical protein
MCTDLEVNTMKPSLGRVLIRTSIALACLALGPNPFAAPANPAKPAAPIGPKLHITGRSLDADGTYAGPVDIFIERWSTDEERDKVVKPLLAKNSSDAVLAALENVRVRVGYVLTPGIQNAGLRTLGRRSWNIDYAHEVKTANGRRIVVASQDSLPIGEFPRDVAARDTQHHLAILDIRFDGDGKGVGKLADAKKLAFNKTMNTIEIAKYEAEPVRLADVVSGPVKTRTAPPKEYYGAKSK